MRDLNQLVDFLVEVEKLKKTYRFSTCPRFADSSAEHSWKLSFMASVFSDDFPEIDASHAIEICLVHDLAEYVTGEIDSYRIHKGEITKEQKYDLELKAMEEFKERLPVGQKIYRLWREFEEQQTPEAQYARALDKMEVLIHMMFEGIEHDNAPDYTNTYADSSVREVPKLMPFLKSIKQKLKQEYQRKGIEWKPEYEEFP